MKPFQVKCCALLTLLACVAFTALNTSCTAARAQSGSGSSGLSSVAHDSTLSGDGTTSTPLGIANGAISAAKLSPTQQPSSGQVLGFDGAALKWQSAPVSGIRVVDSLGKDVGAYLGNYQTNSSSNVSIDKVLMLVGGQPSALYAAATGFVNISGARGSFLHTTPDCSGTRYLAPLDAGALYRPSPGTSNLTNSTAQTATQYAYSAGPYQTQNFLSVEFVGADMNTTGTCSASLPPAPPLTANAGPATIVNLSTLGFTPPFHIQF